MVRGRNFDHSRASKIAKNDRQLADQRPSPRATHRAIGPFDGYQVISNGRGQPGRGHQADRSCDVNYPSALERTRKERDGGASLPGKS